MDRLSIFGTGANQVEIVSKEGSTLDTVLVELEKANREARLLRAGHEEWTWEEQVENSEIDLEELGLEMEE